MNNVNLSGKVVVITGASSGFGKGAALRFAREGGCLVLAARRDELLNELAQDCRTVGGRAIAIPTDVSNADEVAQLAAVAISTYGCIDVWVNNAGVAAVGRFEDVPLDDHVHVIGTDLLGTLYGSYYAYRCFLEQQAGVLINIASELSKTAVPYYTSYAAAKHGVVGLTDSLRQEVKQRKLSNIHICAILPTAHDTPFFDHAANYTGHEIVAPKPLHDPHEVIDAILDIARRPEDQKIVGGDGILKVLMSNLMPGVAEKMEARQMHKTQFEDAPPGEDSSGAVRGPINEGTDITAGRRH